MQYCPHCMEPTDKTGYCPSCGKPMDEPPKEHQLHVGTILTVGKDNAYLLGASLGQGGFGITYVARDQREGQRVALKEYFPVQCCQRLNNGQVSAKNGMESVFEKGKKSFLEEARMLSKQQHIASVVKVMDYFEMNGTAYLVMEYLDGETLQHKAEQEGLLQPELLMSKLPKLLEDMEALHRSGVIHRDISPDNVMWMPDDTLKLLDFGCARSMEDGKSMTVQLKHGFAPVEQYMTRGQGPWTDVYALSATVYYCLTGKVPPMAPERLEADHIQSPSALGVRMDGGQEEALMWGLTVQPKARPVSMEVFRARMFGGAQKFSTGIWQSAMENSEKKEYGDRAEPVEQTKETPFGNLSKKQTILIVAAAIIVLVAALTVIRIFS